MRLPSIGTWKGNAMSAMRKAIVAGGAVVTALWIAPVGAGDAAAERPGDEAMTCEQIATELAPYMQQLMPNIQALGTSQQQLYEQARPKLEQRKAEHEALTTLATAGALDKTGVSKRAYQMALMAQAAKDKTEDEALANSPLAQESKAYMEQLAAQGQQMQSNARLRRLMQLAQQKHC
jgi:hypothetical protein